MLGLSGAHLDLNIFKENTRFFKIYFKQCSFVSTECMSYLFVEPENGAGHTDVSQADPLAHQEGACVQVVVQHCKGPLHILLGLLCGLHRIKPRNEYASSLAN